MIQSAIRSGAAKTRAGGQALGVVPHPPGAALTIASPPYRDGAIMAPLLKEGGGAFFAVGFERAAQCGHEPIGLSPARPSCRYKSMLSCSAASVLSRNLEEPLAPSSHPAKKAVCSSSPYCARISIGGARVAANFRDNRVSTPTSLSSAAAMLVRAFGDNSL
jgi:hypothetical protein